MSTDMFADSVRAILIFSHLLLFVGVFAVVVWSDFVILKKGVHAAPFKIIVDTTVILLLLLWLTGLIIVYVDTQFNYLTIIQKPKLIVKLLCVSVLSINGIVLHAICFKHLINRERLERKHATVISICGAISSSHWLLSAFVGNTTMLNQFSLANLLTIYTVILCLVIMIAFAISTSIQSHINRFRARDRLNELGISTYNQRHNLIAH